jgi:excisionase family DNA binding protein
MTEFFKDVNGNVFEIEEQPINLKERFLSTKQVGCLLSIDFKVIQKWMREGKMPGFVAGKEWRISETDLKAWINDKKELSLKRWSEGTGCLK